MRDALAELDVPPWRRNSNKHRFTASVLVAGLLASSAYAGLGMLAEPVPEPKWTIDVPDDFGDPILAQFSGDRIAVTSQNGVTVVDVKTGKRVWEQELPSASLEVLDGELNFATAPVVTPVIGDIMLVTEYDDAGFLEALPSNITVLDVRTGEERFSISPEAGHEMEGSVTQSTFAVRECEEPYEPDCSLTGYDLSNGQPKWSFDREFEAEDLSFPAPLHESIQHGQMDLPNMVMEPAVVPSEAHAVLTEHDYDESDFDKKIQDVTTIDMNTGELGTWRDTAESYDDVGSYTPMNDWLLRSDPTGLSTVDPATGETRHDLSLRGSYATDGTSLTSQPGVLVDGDKLLDIEAAGDDVTMDGVESYQIMDPASGQALSENAVNGLLVGANDGTVVTVSDTDDNPLLRGIDTDTGEQSWRNRLYPESGEASGLQTTALLLRDGTLAMTGTPSSWKSDYFDGEAQTRLVRLSDGETEVLDNVTALGLGSRGLLGYVHASEEDDTPAQLAYYPVPGRHNA